MPWDSQMKRSFEEHRARYGASWTAAKEEKFWATKRKVDAIMDPSGAERFYVVSSKRDRFGPMTKRRAQSLLRELKREEPRTQFAIQEGY